MTKNGYLFVVLVALWALKAQYPHPEFDYDVAPDPYEIR
jgi:hypothetical protein